MRLNSIAVYIYAERSFGQDVSFILSSNTAALSHRKPASAGTSDSCRVRAHDKRDYMTAPFSGLQYTFSAFVQM
jgi:hypothetical protein